MSDMTEKEALSRVIEGFRQAEGACRVLGHYRRDERWIFLAQLILKIMDKASQLAMRGLVES